MNEVRLSDEDTDPQLLRVSSLRSPVPGPLAPAGHWDVLSEGSCPPIPWLRTLNLAVITATHPQSSKRGTAVPQEIASSSAPMPRGCLSLTSIGF